jgi:hypothetical protein
MDGNPLITPVGSLPPQVYWRRRALAAAVAVLIVWFAWSWFPGGGGAHAAGQPTKTPGAGASTSPAAAPTTTAVPAATTTAAKPAPVATVTSPAPATATTTSAAPTVAKCAASALLVTISTDHTAYSATAEPHFVLTVSNVGKTACQVDVGTANRGFEVHSGSDRIWASTDCTKKAANVVVFKPKDTVSYSSVWTRQRSSSAGCAAKGTGARAGTYVVEAHLGDLTTRKAVFRLS